MLVPFFFELRAAGVPVSLTELLSLLEALKEGVAEHSAQDFYYLARACLVKDERHYDRFDLVFAQTFEGAHNHFADWIEQVPEEWLKALMQPTFPEEQRRAIEALGGWDKLLERLRELLREQSERHEGGKRWIGTARTSSYGAFGFNPQGIRMGQGGGEHRAVKVWERREYRNFDDRIELGTRNMKVALKRLRKLAREGAAEQLDLEGTVNATARNAGVLDLRLVPERRNIVRVLLFLDAGGSMDDHVQLCEELFSAARSELRHLEHFYFHNFIYESLWRDNSRRDSSMISTSQVLRTYGREYRVIFVGDASMSPYEILAAGGSIEHWNQEPGSTWMKRMVSCFPRLVWLNPRSRAHWDYTPSVRITRELIAGRMFPLTIEGLDEAIRELRQPLAPALSVLSDSPSDSSLGPSAQ
jgi:uncharacterized protein with von Willebrand factor type A (vWA) domain